ncbi:MAG: hypothetical protein HN350_18210, partial [Phycisphaerales bacterium]|nr:hypothetical protein [Phycisphaerales bacterium]
MPDYVAVRSSDQYLIHVENDGGSERGSYRLVFGDNITTVAITPPTDVAPQPHQYEPATPISSVSQPGTVPGLDLSASPLDLRQSYWLEGPAGAKLDNPMNLGDVTGDGIDDIMVSGQLGHYIIIGPLDITGGGEITDEMSIFVSPDLGSPAERVGDFDGDGVNDFAFIKINPGPAPTDPGNVIVTVIPGGSAIPRELTTSTPSTYSCTLESSDPSVPVRLSALNFDGDGFDDLVLVAEKPVVNVPGSSNVYGCIFRGSLFDVSDPWDATWTISPDDSQDVWDDSLPSGYESLDTKPLLFTVVGDVNGDGFDDLLFSSPEYLIKTGGPEIGLVSILGGREWGWADEQVLYPCTSRQAWTGLGSTYQYVLSGYTLGRQLFALGDINDDGYDDFTVSRRVEGSITDDSGLLVFLGNPEFAVDSGVDLGAQADTAEDAAAIKFAFDDLHMGSDLFYGDYSITAGDLDDNGSCELVVGVRHYYQNATWVPASNIPSWDNSQGQIRILWDADQTDTQYSKNYTELQELEGVYPTDAFGSLVSGGSLDANADGIDDLLVTASGAYGLLGGFSPDAGALYVAYGHGVPLPQGDHPDSQDVQVVSNRVISGSGEFLIDRATGQNETFDFAFSAVSDTDTDRWFAFTTLGDGQEGDFVRVSPGLGLHQFTDDGDASLASHPKADSGFVLDLYDEGFRIVRGGGDSGKTRLDLRNLKAGTYYLRVAARGTELSSLEKITLEFAPPAPGRSHDDMDRDAIAGGGGSDVLVGSEGWDDFVELEPDEEPIHVPRDVTDSVDPSVRLEDIFLDTALLEAAGEALGGLAQTIGTRKVYRVSDLAELETLDLSSWPMVGDLTGLEHLTGLRQLVLDSTAVTDLSPLASLASLEFLSARDIGQIENDQPGLIAEYFKITEKPGSGDTDMPDFNALGSPIVTRVEQNVDYDWGTGDVGGIVGYKVAVRWMGSIEITNAGLYNFMLNSDDGSMLYIDGQLIVSNGGVHTDQSSEHTGLALGAGKHAIRVEFFEWTGNAEVHLKYAGNDTGWHVKTVPTDVLSHTTRPVPSLLPGLVGEYFDITDVIPSSPAADWMPDFGGLDAGWRQIDPQINFAWDVRQGAGGSYTDPMNWEEEDLGAPFVGGFSEFNDDVAVLWTGKIKLPSSALGYNFYLASDDGSQLYVDGNLIVDVPGTHTLDTINSTTLGLVSAGLHDIQVEYFEKAGGAGICLLYQEYVEGSNAPIKIVTADMLFHEGPEGLYDLSGVEGLTSLRVADFTGSNVVDASALIGERVVDDGDAGFESAGPLADAGVYDDLIASYRFDEGEGLTAHDAVNGYNATLKEPTGG